MPCNSCGNRTDSNSYENRTDSNSYGNRTDSNRCENRTDCTSTCNEGCIPKHTSCVPRDVCDYDLKGLPYGRVCRSHNNCDCYARLGLEYTHVYFNAFPKCQRQRYSRFNNDPRCDIGMPCCGSRANPCNPKYGPINQGCCA